MQKINTLLNELNIPNKIQPEKINQTLGNKKITLTEKQKVKC